MKILEVTFECTIAMPGYNNVKPGIGRVILEEGDTPEQAWTELNRRAQEWHKKEYPHLYPEKETYPKPYDPRDRFDKLTSGQLPPTEVTYGPPPVINIQHERME